MAHFEEYSDLWGHFRMFLPWNLRILDFVAPWIYLKVNIWWRTHPCWSSILKMISKIRIWYTRGWFISFPTNWPSLVFVVWTKSVSKIRLYKSPRKSYRKFFFHFWRFACNFGVFCSFHESNVYPFLRLVFRPFYTNQRSRWIWRKIRCVQSYKQV